jgi:hypothetical protein
MRNALPILLLSLLFAGHATASNKKKSLLDTLAVPPYYRYSLHSNHYISLLTGYNFSKNDLAEIGLGYSTRRRKKSNNSGTVLYLADEISLRNSLVMGAKVGVWTANGLAAGAAFIYYTNFNGGKDMRLRPEVGIGEHSFKITYGYNIPMGDKLPGVSDHIVTLTANWRLTHGNDKLVERDWDAKGRKKYIEGHEDTTFSRHTTLIMGGIDGSNVLCGDVGLGWCFDETVSRKKNTVAGVFFAGAEFRPLKEPLIRPKVGLYMYGRGKVGPCVGLSLIYYTRMEYNALVIRPELGIHIGASRIVYGYNHMLAGHSFDPEAQHNVSAIIALRISPARNGYSVSKKDRNF